MKFYENYVDPYMINIVKTNYINNYNDIKQLTFPNKVKFIRGLTGLGMMTCKKILNKYIEQWDDEINDM